MFDGVNISFLSIYCRFYLIWFYFGPMLKVASAEKMDGWRILPSHRSKQPH